MASEHLIGHGMRRHFDDGMYLMGMMMVSEGVVAAAMRPSEGLNCNETTVP